MWILWQNRKLLVLLTINRLMGPTGREGWHRTTPSDGIQNHDSPQRGTFPSAERWMRLDILWKNLDKMCVPIATAFVLWNPNLVLEKNRKIGSEIHRTGWGCVGLLLLLIVNGCLPCVWYTFYLRRSRGISYDLSFIRSSRRNFAFKEHARGFVNNTHHAAGVFLKMRHS